MSSRRPFRLFVGVLLILMAAHALWHGLTVPTPGTPEGTRVAVAQLRHLGQDLEADADRMQRFFPEGRVFTLALYGLAWVDIGLSTDDAALRADALAEAHRALALAQAPASLAPFGPTGGLPYGMFYHAWTGRLHAGALHLGGGAAQDTLFQQTCNALAASIQAYGPFVPSYGTAAWPADTAVGAATLRSCGALLGGPYTAAAEAWLATALAYTDPATGLLRHSATAPAVRASSLTLLVPFLYEIDPGVARTQFEGVQTHFPTRFLGLPTLREYPRGVDGVGDVDSGPLVAGVSASASVVGIAAAQITGHPSVAADLRAAPEVLGFPFEWRGRRVYGFGQLPVGEAFLAWASTIRPWTAPVAPVTPETPFAGWRAVWTLVWSGVALVGLGLTVTGARRRRPGPAYAGPKQSRQ